MSDLSAALNGLKDFSVKDVTSAMLKAAEGVADSGWDQLKSLAEAQFRTLAEQSAKVVLMKSSGFLNTAEAEAWFSGIKLAARDTFLAIQTVARNTLIKAWNAAIGVLVQQLETATGIHFPV